MTRHGKDCPRWCSQCQPDVAVRRITTRGADLLIDGQPSGRNYDHEPAQRMALMKKRRPR